MALPTVAGQPLDQLLRRLDFGARGLMPAFGSGPAQFLNLLIDGLEAGRRLVDQTD